MNTQGTRGTPDLGTGCSCGWNNTGRVQSEAGGDPRRGRVQILFFPLQTMGIHRGVERESDRKNLSGSSVRMGGDGDSRGFHEPLLEGLGFQLTLGEALASPSAPALMRPHQGRSLSLSRLPGDMSDCTGNLALRAPEFLEHPLLSLLPQASSPHPAQHPAPKCACRELSTQQGFPSRPHGEGVLG